MEWYFDEYPISLEARPNYVLTPEAEDRLSAFLYYGERGCTCFQGHAPCSHCTHDGNPANISADDTAWRELTADEVAYRERMRKAKQYRRRGFLLED